ncbi:hypothetical protein B0H13DRAFT_1874770 [Mycena leptocephala]|nr:hypothetical protein B0H13DRAFT_1874770 [Mycena leptocephala]
MITINIPELLCEIAFHLDDVRDLSHLSQCDHFLNEVVAPLLFKDMFVSEKHLPDLSKRFSDHPEFAQQCKSLVIHGAQLGTDRRIDQFDYKGFDMESMPSPDIISDDSAGNWPARLHVFHEDLEGFILLTRNGTFPELKIFRLNVGDPQACSHSQLFLNRLQLLERLDLYCRPSIATSSLHCIQSPTSPFLVLSLSTWTGAGSGFPRTASTIEALSIDQSIVLDYPAFVFSTARRTIKQLRQIESADFQNRDDMKEFLRLVPNLLEFAMMGRSSALDNIIPTFGAQDLFFHLRAIRFFDLLKTGSELPERWLKIWATSRRACVTSNGKSIRISDHHGSPAGWEEKIWSPSRMMLAVEKIIPDECKLVKTSATFRMALEGTKDEVAGHRWVTRVAAGAQNSTRTRAYPYAQPATGDPTRGDN